MKTPALMLIVVLTVAQISFAVDPPPDGGYANGNTAEGEDALFSDNGSAFNTAVGFDALYHNKTQNYNTAIGANALYWNTQGLMNTAVGFLALYENTAGMANSATGQQALYNNTTGNDNSAIGFQALFSNLTGNNNTAVGVNALYTNANGNNNTAIGEWALFGNYGSNNTATGVDALFNGGGDSNTADGVNALASNPGSFNTAVGQGALYSTTSANNNTAVGYQALRNNTSGGNNIAIGNSAGINLTTGSNNIHIGALGVAGESNTIRIGSVNTPPTAVFIQGISGATSVGGVGVMVNSSGRLGTMTSSARYKKDIKPMNAASEAILSLQPVTFRYMKELDPQAIPQFGLVAEDVAKVDPDLVARDDQGKPYTVRYEAVNAMLLNEFLKEHKKVEELERQLQQMGARLDAKGL